MKIFLDTAHIPSIEALKETSLIDGVTTNPSHLSKEGSAPKQQVLAIAALLPKGEISVEVTEKEPKDVYEQALRIAALSPNIIVKIPCYRDYYSVIKRLVHEGIGINITLLFSLSQALMMGKMGVRYISPFIGRLDDAGCSGLHTLNSLCTMMHTYSFTTKVLAASLRSVHDVEGSIQAGADAITVSPDLFNSMTQHPLTDKGMALFDADWKKLAIKQFP